MTHIVSKNSLSQVFHSSVAEKGIMILLLVTFFPLTYKIISPVLILTGFGEYTSSITGVLYLVGIVCASPRIRNGLKPIDVGLYLTFATFFLISRLLYPRSSSFVEKNAFDFLIYVVPFYFLGVLVNYKRDRILIQNVMRIAFFIAVYWETCILMGLVDFGTVDGTIGEQMEFAYSLLIVVCYMLVEYNKSHSYIELIGFFLGSLMLLFMGTRGPVVLLFTFVTVYLVLFQHFGKRNFLKKTFIVALFGVFYIYSKPLLMALSIFSVQFGLSNKIFESILDDSMINLEESSGRDTIYETMLSAIKADPSGFGYGFGGDRLFSESNGYAHNLELEVFVEFGYIGGIIFFLFLLFLFVQSYNKVKGTTSASFLLVIFFWGFMSLQFSMSWLIYPGFFFLIGYCISIIRTKRIDIIECN